MPGKAAEDGPAAWACCTHVGDRKETPGLCLTLLSAATWEVTQRMENLLSVILSNRQLEKTDLCVWSLKVHGVFLKTVVGRMVSNDVFFLL